MVTAVRQRAGAASLIGPRDVNQDQYHLNDLALDGGKVLAILAVADGMGGMQAGEVASAVAVRAAIAALDEVGGDVGSLRDVVCRADDAVRSLESQGITGAGTTLTLAVVTSGEATIAHVGDTRAYVLHAGELVQVTEDHSRVGRLLRDGIISEVEAMSHPEQNILERALGVGPRAEVDLYRVGLGPGDVLLLSSDGLHGVLTAGEMQAQLACSSSLQEACDALTATAEVRGSQDNITAVGWQYPGGTPARPVTDVRRGPARTTRAAAQQIELVKLLGILLAAFGGGTLLGIALRVML